MIMKVSNRTRSWDEALLNKNISVELLRDISVDEKSLGSVFLFILIKWKQQYEKSEWVTLSGVEWCRRTGMGRAAKTKAAKRLIESGYIETKNIGRKSTLYRSTGKGTLITTRSTGKSNQYAEELVPQSELPDISDYLRAARRRFGMAV